MKEDAPYQTILDRVEGPTNETEKADLEQEMGFNYRNALGKALFAMITCRPDISFKGLIYWRKTTHKDIMLQSSDIPKTFHKKPEHLQYPVYALSLKK